MLGAGGSGIGVADGLRAAMKGDGLSEEEARSRFWVIDIDGPTHSGRKNLTPEQAVYAQPENRVSGWPRTSNGHIGLADVIGKINATTLIGFSTVGGAFSEPIVREMARKVERHIFFPLSNPTSKSESNGRGSDSLDRRTRFGRVGLSICTCPTTTAARLPSRNATTFIFFQQWDLPLWLRRSPGHRRNDAGCSARACREFARPQDPSASCFLP